MLVPEPRTDKNGVTSTRWVKQDQSVTSSANLLPAPSVPSAVTSKNEQQRLYVEILARLNQDAFRKRRNANIRNLEEWHRRRSDQTSLFRTLLANTESSEPFKFIEQVHDILNYYGAEDIPSLINDESLESVVIIIESTEHLQADAFFLPEETRDMIDYALTSEDRELITRVIKERSPDTLREVEELVIEARRSQPALQSGVL
jgi:hypothetical protein